jgi:predicted lipase
MIISPVTHPVCHQVPTAHRGFLARSKSIDVEALYQMALDSNRHLVLCGHSLGGAVAKLCTLRLLRKLPEWPPPQLRCICFAAPAVGNSALAKAVEEAGWDSFFKTYALPGGRAEGVCGWVGGSGCV